MKILIVAYACEPDKGSEPGIGWDWSLALANRSSLDVTVLTRANNRTSIESALQSGTPDNLHFIYHDLPVWAQNFKKWSHSIYPYYFLWCLSVRQRARKLVDRNNFVILHHLTFSTDWLPGCIPNKINCATILGPLGGYNTAPVLKNLVPMRYVVTDYFRKSVRAFGLFLRQREFRRCDTLIANNETFGAHYRRLAPGANIATVSTQLCSALVETKNSLPRVAKPANTKSILMAGRMLYWKGLDAALDALAYLKKDGVDFEAILIGDGPSDFVTHLKEKCEILDLGKQLKFVGNLPRDEFLAQMEKADVFLYPTLYGTADSIMIESIERNVPIVCFPSSGAIELLGKDYPYLSNDFSPATLAALIKVADKESTRYQSARSRLHIRHSPQSKVAQVETIYQQALGHSQPLDELTLQDA